MDQQDKPASAPSETVPAVDSKGICPETVAPTPVMLTTRQAVQALGVSDATLREWRKQGMPYLPVGNQPRYFLDEVVAWLKDRQVAAITAD